MTNNNVVTLSWLLAQDLPQAYIFTERPSTYNHKAAFINDKKYVIHDYSPDITGDSRHLKAMRACPVAGSKFPILVTRDINPLIREVSILLLIHNVQFQKISILPAGQVFGFAPPPPSPQEILVYFDTLLLKS